MHPEITVVIPTRDRWHMLSRTLPGVLRQEGVDLEAVVVDDGSRDGTADQLARLDDERLRYVSHPTPEGVARARNSGINEARGAWVAFLDDDDLWAPRKLRTQLDTATRLGARFVYCSAVVVDGALNVLLDAPAPGPTDLLPRLLSVSLIPAGPSNVIVERGLLRELGGFDERLASLADWDLWIRLAARTTAAVCPETLVAYVEHGENMQRGGLEIREREFLYMAEKHRDLCERFGVAFGGPSLERSAARHQRLRGQRLASARTYLHASAKHREPALAARAVIALLGEPVTQLVRRLRGRALIARPDWLDFYPALRRT